MFSYILNSIFFLKENFNALGNSSLLSDQNSFWYRQGLNLRSFIQPSKIYQLSLGPAQGIMGPKAITLSELYSYTLNINRIFI